MLLYSTGLVPEVLLEYLVRRRLEDGPPHMKSGTAVEERTTAPAAVEEELPKEESSTTTVRSSESNPQLAVTAAVVRSFAHTYSTGSAPTLTTISNSNGK